MDSKALDARTHIEIFQRPRHFKKPINYINYSGCEYNPINNSSLEEKTINYRNEKIQEISAIELR